MDSETRLKQIDAMLAKNPEDDFLVYAAALEYQKRNDTEKAVQLLQSIKKRNPDYLAVYYQLGKILESNNNIAEALATYKAGKEIAKTQSEQKALQELSEAILLLEE